MEGLSTVLGIKLGAKRENSHPSAFTEGRLEENVCALMPHDLMCSCVCVSTCVHVYHAYGYVHAVCKHMSVCINRDVYIHMCGYLHA